MFYVNGNPIPLDVAFTDINGIQRPANFLRLATVEEKAEAGVVEVPDAPRPDDRFYWVDSMNGGIPKDLDQLKAEWSRQVNQIAYTMLAPTDWMVIRKMEAGIDVPADVAAYRSAVRLAAGTNQADLNAAADIDAFIAVATMLKWPEAPK